VFGKLKIVPSAELGQLGPQQGEAASFDWKWYYSAAGWVIWLVLILAFIAPKANHDIQVLFILIPLVVVNLLWRLFMRYANMNSTDELEFTLIFNSMAVAVAVLWLIANYFIKFGGTVRFLLSLGIVMIIAGLGTLFYSTEFSSEMALILALLIFMALAMLAAITLSRRLCSGKYRPVRFMLWLALWMLLVSLISTLGFSIVVSIIISSGQGLSELTLMSALAGLIFGLCLYVLNLPFFILGFANPFFRKRFCVCLGLKAMPESPKQAGTRRFNGQNSGTEIPEKGDFV